MVQGEQTVRNFTKNNFFIVWKHLTAVDPLPEKGSVPSYCLFLFVLCLDIVKFGASVVMIIQFVDLFELIEVYCGWSLSSCTGYVNIFVKSNIKPCKKNMESVNCC